MKISYIFGAIALMSVAVSCEQEFDTYEGEAGMYFDTRYKNAETLSDTIYVSWGMEPSAVKQQEIGVTVKLFGKTAPFDRAFSVEVTTDDGDDMAAVEGTDFIKPATDYVIKAGESETVIPVTLLRREDLHLQNRRFKIRLIENDQLKFLYSRVSTITDEDGNVTSRDIDLQRVILMDESLPMPGWWSYRGEPYFGTYSQTKAVLICDVMNIDRKRWVDLNALSEGYLKFCGRYMQRWLNEQYELDPSNPVLYEDDGRRIEMGEKSLL